MTNEEIQALLDLATEDVKSARANAANAADAANRASDTADQALVHIAAARAALDVVVEPPPDPDPPPPVGVLPRYGGATGFEIINANSTNASINAELDKWADVGCQILRVDLLQSAPYIAKFHTVANGCFQRGMKIMACLRGTSGPYGAASAGAFGKAMAVEFGTSVAAYEYVNEPNLGAPRYTPQAYGPELAAAYNAIKGVNSNLLVATGGMGWDSAGDFSQWWPGAYNSGGKDHFDLWNCHLYDQVTGANWSDALNTHAQYGQGKPIVVTEAGSRNAQATVIPAALKDQRVQAVCIYNMMVDVPGFEMWKGTVATSPGYQAYKATPKV